MGLVGNAVFASFATGVLLTGLLVLIPQPAAAILPQAPGVVVADNGNLTDGSLTTRLTSVIVVPAGEFLPIIDVTTLAFPGAPLTFADGLVATATGGAPLNCGPTTVVSVTGATSTFGRFGAYGYGNPLANGNGYGFDFTGSPASVTFDDYDGGYAPGYGYGYGSESSRVVLTLTVDVADCPQAADFAGAPAAQFTFQIVFGALDAQDDGGLFATLPSTVTLRNPEAPLPNPASPPASTVGVTSTFQVGDVTVLRYTLAGDGDATDENVPRGTVPLPLPAVPGSFLRDLDLTIQGNVPEGAGVEVSIFGPGTSAFNIDPATLASLVGPAGAAGFISVQMTGVPPGSASSLIDLTVELDVPATYFTANGFSANTFRLVRFTDAGARSAPDPSCALRTGPAGVPPAYTYRCTLTQFSSFALVASIGFRSGGGAGAEADPPAVQPTAAPSPQPTGSLPVDTVDPTVDPNDEGNTKKRSWIPGAELGILAVALLGLAVAARRQLK